MFKIIDTFLIVLILIMVVNVVVYSFFDIVFSLGIIYPTVDIRDELLIIEYILLFIVIIVFIIRAIIQKHKK